MTKPPTTILIVEDDSALNDAYSTILSSVKQYVVWRAYNGEEALELIRRQGEPDVILLDLRMPTMDGIHFLRQFKPVEHPATAIVVFSNYDVHRDIDEAYELGVERYVLKARATPADLLHMIDGIVSSKPEHS